MLGKSPDVRLRQATGFVESGFNAIKVAVGINLEDDLKFIKELRDKFGYDLRIALDANCSLSFKKAVSFARALERFEIHWLEEPLPPEYLDDYIDLRKNSLHSNRRRRVRVYGVRLQRLDIQEGVGYRPAGCWTSRNFFASQCNHQSTLEAMALRASGFRIFLVHE